MQGFWKNLKKPIFCLAPMADVTDVAFRQIIAKYSRHGEKNGGPDVFWTEFVSADGLMHPKGREKLLIDLKYSEREHPIVAQLFSSNVENMENACKFVRKLGFDGIDLNMGCPSRTIEKQGTGAAHIKDIKHAKEIIRAAKRGAGDLPVSVKTRLGYNENIMEEWVPAICKEGIVTLTMHLRIRKEMSKVPARWNLMKDVVELAKGVNKDILVIGNGDVLSIPDARKKVEETGADGVMVGKGIFGNPWLFDKDKNSVTVKERLEIMLEHTFLYEELLGNHKNFSIMKKHYKAYVNDFVGAKELRDLCMQAENGKEVEKIIQSFMHSVHSEALNKEILL